NVKISLAACAPSAAASNSRSAASCGPSRGHRAQLDAVTQHNVVLAVVGPFEGDAEMAGEVAVPFSTPPAGAASLAPRRCVDFAQGHGQQLLHPLGCNDVTGRQQPRRFDAQHEGSAGGEVAAPDAEAQLVLLGAELDGVVERLAEQAFGIV